MKHLISFSGKDNQPITGRIFYCRNSAGFSVSASNILSCILTWQCFETGNKNIPPNRYISTHYPGLDGCNNSLPAKEATHTLFISTVAVNAAANFSGK
jgi:hypothetical protein